MEKRKILDEQEQIGFNTILSEVTSPKAAPVPDLSGSFIQREFLRDENGNEKSAEAVIRRTHSQHMDLDQQASQMGEKNPIL